MGIPRKEERPRIKSREKAEPWEIEMGSSGEFHRRNMLKSSLWNTKEAHLAAHVNSKQQGDVELYWQLLGYGEFQGYDLGREDVLRQIAKGLYYNSHKPSRREIKHLSISLKTPKNISGDKWTDGQRQKGWI